MNELVREAAYVATLYSTEPQSLARLIAEDAEAVLAGILEAIGRNEDRRWTLLMHLDAFSVEQLEAAGAPPDAVERKRALMAQATSEPVAPRTPRRPFTREREEFVPPPTLRDLLDLDRAESDPQILRGSQHLASQASQLDENHAQDLRARLDEWWPTEPFAETITNVSAHSWSIKHESAAWIWLGPPLDKPMAPEQWAQLACCGVLFTPQLEWLERNCTAEALRHLAEVCTTEDARIWSQALEAARGDFPPELVAAVTERLRTANDEHELRQVARGLLAGAGVEPLRLLAQRSKQFAAVMRPYLAQEGDLEAQRQLLEELIDELRAGRRPAADSYAWLDALDSDGMLPLLFQAVELLYGPSSRIPEGSTWFRHDVLSPVMAAIRTIGGRQAVAGFDELLVKSEDYRFLRTEREAIAQAMLKLDGLEAAARVAQRLGLPFFA